MKTYALDDETIEYLSGVPARRGDQSLIRLQNGTIALVMRDEGPDGKELLVNLSWSIPE